VFPVSPLLLIHLLPCSVTSGGACVTGVAAATISWRRRWHRRVTATARLWRSRRAVPRSCSPPLPTRCGVRFRLLLLPLPPSVCPSQIYKELRQFVWNCLRRKRANPVGSSGTHVSMLASRILNSLHFCLTRLIFLKRTPQSFIHFLRAHHAAGWPRTTSGRFIAATARVTTPTKLRLCVVDFGL
jgi:hypothetical protein